MHAKGKEMTVRLKLGYTNGVVVVEDDDDDDDVGEEEEEVNERLLYMC